MQPWQRDRIARLTALAAHTGEEIGMLTALDPQALARRAALFGRRFEFLEPHRRDSALRGERIAAYAPAPGAEECPACWVSNGYRTPLAVRESLGRADITACPRCSFCELLPNTD